MIPHHVYYQLAIVGLLWLCIMLHYVWPSQGARVTSATGRTRAPQFKRKRSNEPKPFEGLTQRPLAPRVNTTPTIPRRRLHSDPSRCRRPTDARVPSTPRGTSAPMWAVTIEAG